MTEENVEAAESGELSVSFPWLQNFEEVNEEDAHPVSGSSEHYSLYDRFHEKNSSDRYEILRRVTFVKELCGRVNTQTEEQLHSQEVKNNYFLNMMKSTNHLFLFRSIIDRRNEQINSSQRQLMSKKLGCDEFILDQLGRLHSSNALKLGQMGKRVESNRSRNDNITPSSMSNSTEVPSMPQDNQQFMAPQNNNPKKQSTLSSDDRYLFHLRSIIKVDNNDARLTSAKNDFATIQANRNFWGRPMHVKQLQMVMEVLDERKDAYEPIITVSNKLLTRSDFWTLGRNQEVDCKMVDASLHMVKSVADNQGINIEYLSGYITPTLLEVETLPKLETIIPNLNCVTLFILPAWRPGHWCITFIDVIKMEICYLDSLFLNQVDAPENTWEVAYINMLERLVLRNFVSDDSLPFSESGWKVLSGWDEVSLPIQTRGVDCGVFVIMYALYKVLQCPYDFSVNDMITLRVWLVLILLENYKCRSLRGDIEYEKYVFWSDYCNRGEDPMPERWKRLLQLSKRIDEIEKDCPVEGTFEGKRKDNTVKKQANESSERGPAEETTEETTSESETGCKSEMIEGDRPVVKTSQEPTKEVQEESQVNGGRHSRSEEDVSQESIREVEAKGNPRDADDMQYDVTVQFSHMNINDLPDSQLLDIFSILCLDDETMFMCLSLVCTKWNYLVNNEGFRQQVYFQWLEPRQIGKKEAKTLGEISELCSPSMNVLCAERPTRRLLGFKDMEI